MWDSSSLSNSHPLQWECEVLITEPSENSPFSNVYEINVDMDRSNSFILIAKNIPPYELLFFLHLFPNQWKLSLLIFLCNKKCYNEHIFIHIYWNFFKNYPQDTELLSQRICIFNFMGWCQISHWSDCANLYSL